MPLIGTSLVLNIANWVENKLTFAFFFVFVWINCDYVRTQNVCAFIDWYPPLWSTLQLPCRSHERAGSQAMFVLPRWSVRSNQPNCRHTEGRRVSSRTTDRIFALTTKSEEFVWNMLNTNLWRVYLWEFEDMLRICPHKCIMFAYRNAPFVKISRI